MSTDESELNQDVIFDVLSSSRRRYVLYFLSQHGEPVELPTLAEEVAAWETETSVEDLSPQERKRVYVSLYQTHVPKLQEVGLVTYDQDSGEVALTSRSDQIQNFLREPPSTRGRLAQLVGVLAVSLAVPLLAVLLVPSIQASAELLAILAVWAVAVPMITYLVYRRQESGRFPRSLRDR